MKLFAYIALIVAAYVSGNIYGYKSAISDSAASVTYAEMQTAIRHLDSMPPISLDEAHQALVKNLAATTVRHQKHVNEQSFLSQHEGPNNETLMVTNRAEIYALIDTYLKSTADFEGKQQAIESIEELQSN